MENVKKCRAKGGAAQCANPRCPEKLASEIFNVPTFFNPRSFPKEKLPNNAWSENDTVLFKTIHGSKLYGLNHANSDDDFYIITPTRKTSRHINAKQSIVGKDDTVAIDFSSFVELSHKGVPQALEAMFSRKAESPFFEEYRANYFASDPEVIHTYMRTIKSFSLSEKDGFKRRRHSLRLALNLEELIYTGRFNPTLNKPTALKITRLAKKENNAFIKELKAISPIEVDWQYEE